MVLGTSGDLRQKAKNIHAALYSTEVFQTRQGHGHGTLWAIKILKTTLCVVYHNALKITERV